MELIDKDAVVAEIERRIKERDNQMKSGCWVSSAYIYEDLLDFLDTLEVKEVDFEKELDRIWFDNKLGNYFDNDALDFAHVRTLCKHFFELGLKAVQKGE